MRDPARKLKRQIEILGLVLSDPAGFTVGTLAGTFRVDEETIKKDLSVLRSRGISINQVRNKGIFIAQPPAKDLLIELLTQYQSCRIERDQFDKSIRMLVKAKKLQSLSLFVLLQRSIEQSRKVTIDYRKDVSQYLTSVEISPLMLFQSDGVWRLLADHDGSIKQYIVSKIALIKPTSKKFTKPSKERLSRLFDFSWKSWIGGDKYHIKLSLTREWAEILTVKPVIDNQEITKLDDDTYTLAATVNSLEEVAGWVVSKGGEVKVLEPRELAEIVCVNCLQVLQAQNYPTEKR